MIKKPALISFLIAFSICSASPAIQIDRIFSKALQNIEELYFVNVSLPIPNSRIPEKVLYGNTEYGFFESREFSVEIDSINLRFQPPGYLSSIFFYIQYPEGNRIKVKSQHFKDPTPLFIKSLFGVSITGNWKTPYVLISTPIFHFINETALARLELSKEATSKKQVLGPRKDNGIIHAILNKYGEIVWAYLAPSYEDAASQSQVLKLGLGKYIFVSETKSGVTLEKVDLATNTKTKHQLRNHNNIQYRTVVLANEKDTFYVLSNKSVFVREGLGKTTKKNQLQTHLWNYKNPLLLWRDIPASNVAASLKPLYKTGYFIHDAKQDKLSVFSELRNREIKTYSLSSISPEEVYPTKSANNFLAYKTSKKGAYLMDFHIKDGELVRSPQTYFPTPPIFASAGGSVFNESDQVLALFNSFSDKKYLIAFNQDSLQEEARVTWGSKYSANARINAAMLTLGSERFIGNQL